MSLIIAALKDSGLLTTYNIKRMEQMQVSSSALLHRHPLDLPERGVTVIALFFCFRKLKLNC